VGRRVRIAAAPIRRQRSRDVKFVVVAVGHKLPDWINAGFNEYARRMPRASPIELCEIKPAPRAGSGEKSIQDWLSAEHARVRAALPARAFVAVLDERGESCTTAGLARRIQRWRETGGDVVFVIGGADGTAQALKDEADLLLSLSPLTLPHGLCRIVMAEQLYRAVSLLANHPYHRA
jgi:23S rRNA (pseudouridine1915-N3)-methyltransferase